MLLKLHHLLIVIIIAVFEPYFLLRVFRLFLESSGKLHEYSMFVPILQVRNCDKSSEFMKPGFPGANGAHGHAPTDLVLRLGTHLHPTHVCLQNLLR